MAKKFTSIDEYIESLPEQAKAQFTALRECVRSVIPEATEGFTYNVPSFTLIDGGKMEQQIMIAGFKKHVGLYPHPTTMEHFEGELSSYKTGTGTVQFPLDHPLPVDLITRMVQYRWGLVNRED